MALEIARNTKHTSLADRDASKRYLYSTEIPHLFECLLSGLIHHQPSNHLAFLKNCLTAVQQSGGIDVLCWDSFIDDDTEVAHSNATSRFSSAKKRSRFSSAKSDAGKKHPTELMPLPRRLVDPGRKADLSQSAEVIPVYVGPIPSRGSWHLKGLPKNAQVAEAFSSGFTDLDDSEDAQIKEHLLSYMFFQKGSNPIILVNYPRNAEQLEWLLNRIGGISHAVFIDYNEETFKNRLAMASERALTTPQAINNTIEAYKLVTMPVIHWLDRQGKLFVIDGKDEDYIQDQLGSFFERKFSMRKRAGSSASSLKVVERSEHVDMIPLTDPFPPPVKATTKLFLLYVGPVHNFDTYRMSLSGKARHIVDNTNAIEKLPAILSLNDGPIVCFNFPSNREQYDWLMRNVGLNFANLIFVDHTEITIRTRLISSHMVEKAVDDALRDFKRDVVPIIHWFDRAGKLFWIDGEADDVIVMKDIAKKLLE